MLQLTEKFNMVIVCIFIAYFSVQILYVVIGIFGSLYYDFTPHIQQRLEHLVLPCNLH